ncbi:hypothetical protein ACHAXT_004884 [Thalassiosira profunda]
MVSLAEAIAEAKDVFEAQRVELTQHLGSNIGVIRPSAFFRGCAPNKPLVAVAFVGQGRSDYNVFYWCLI